MVRILFSHFLKNHKETKFATVHVTTRCNAKCTDRCDIWASKPFDMKLDDLLFAIDVLAKNSFSVVYFTGGETGLYPHLVEAVEYAKKRGLVTSITTNGTIPKGNLWKMRKSLDALSVSVDNYDEQLWDNAKHVSGISNKAKETILTAKSYRIKLYGVTFLNPAWNTNDVEKVVHYVNDELGIPFALSYPYISSKEGTFVVGGNLRGAQRHVHYNIRNMVAKVLQMKLNGSEVATSSCYMREVLRAYDGQPMKYPCKAGKSIITLDCQLNVFPCYKKKKLFNLKENQNLNLKAVNSSLCDNQYCMINCFKEASQASSETILKAAKEELFSNYKFYFKLIT